MPITATSGQNLAQPVRTGQGSITGTSSLLTVGSTQQVITAAAVSEQLGLQVQVSGTPAVDSTVSVAVSPNNSNFSILATIPYADFNLSDSLNSGAARVFTVPIGWAIRLRFNPGTGGLAVAPNGVICRWTN